MINCVFVFVLFFQEQYVFLHKALLCEYQGKGTITSEADFQAKANMLLNDDSPLNQQELYEEFKVDRYENMN